MQKRKSLYAVVLLSVAVFMAAGCANQEAVKKDEGLVPATTAKPSDQAKPAVTPAKQAATTPATQIAAAAAPSQVAQKVSSSSQLQSALEKIYFDFDSANLSESARATLTKNADALKKETSAKIRIEGNCDERGSAEYNLALGERRARSAKQYLTTLGVKADRLTVISYGKEKPAVQGSDEAAWTKNRRDEFVVIAK